MRFSGHGTRKDEIDDRSLLIARRHRIALVWGAFTAASVVALVIHSMTDGSLPSFADMFDYFEFKIYGWHQDALTRLVLPFARVLLSE